MRIVIAFGMGWDCPDVRQTILWGSPTDPESFSKQDEVEEMDYLHRHCSFMQNLTIEGND